MSAYHNIKLIAIVAIAIVAFTSLLTKKSAKRRLRFIMNILGRKTLLKN